MSSAPHTPVHLPPLVSTSRPGIAGMVTFLAGTTVLFVALAIAYVVATQPLRIPPPALPWIFWVSTFVVLASSVFLNYTVQSARAGHPTATHRALLSATGLGYLFLGLQGAGLVMISQLKIAYVAVSATVFTIVLMLVALHLVHTVAGVVYLSIASLRSEKHHYESGDIGQLRPLVIFWHSMAVLWLLLFSLLLIVR